MDSSVFSKVLFFLLIIPFTNSSTNRINKRPVLRTIDQISSKSDDVLSSSSSSSSPPPPTRFFEVTKPIRVPRTKPCSYILLQHDFGYTYGKPPVSVNYTPPLDCPSHDFSKIVLEWESESKGKQFDRIFGVWVGGVEILRSCTAEPTKTGIIWTVEKDITRYHSLLMSNQTVSVYIGNIVDDTYTGVYHVNLKIHFYPNKKLKHHHQSKADLILPISRDLHNLKDGLWFEIENSTDIQSKGIRVPRNTYRAVLEVYVSFHEHDEFWYTNLPNEYIAANHDLEKDGYFGNGPFREIVVSLDGELVGSVWPFTVIYTGGINPLFWRPITAIGSYNLPSYDIEFTPFLGKIIDGKFHQVSFAVTNALNVWYIDANLHLWLDKKSDQTIAHHSSMVSTPLDYSSKVNFNGYDGNFSFRVKRSITSAGWVKSSSHGNVTTKSTQEFSYTNSIHMANKGNSQIVNQLISYNDKVVVQTPSSYHTFKSTKKFPLYLYSNASSQGDNGTSNVIYKSNFRIGFNERRRNKKSGSRRVDAKLVNKQSGDGYMVLKDGKLTGGLGSTRQVYKYYDGRRHELCYFRNVSSSNYTILYDHERIACGVGGLTKLD